METVTNKIALRPRFRIQKPVSKEAVLRAFEKAEKPPFLISRVDDHVYIKFNEEEHHFYSPQLHLEIFEAEGGNSKIHGLFGPNPGLWTFFIFLHFGVATFFVIFGIWAYSLSSLGRPYGLQVAVMIFLSILWVLFYLFGRAGRHKGKPQMEELYTFMEETLAR